MDLKEGKEGKKGKKRKKGKDSPPAAEEKEALVPPVNGEREH